MFLTSCYKKISWEKKNKYEKQLNLENNKNKNKNKVEVGPKKSAGPTELNQCKAFIIYYERDEEAMAGRRE